MKIDNDKYYTPLDLAKHCIDKTYEVLGLDNITEIIEPSAGGGSFSSQIKNCIAYDVEPDKEDIIKQDYLTLELPYKKGRLVIGNPPYGSKLKLAQDFFKKSVSLGDYIAFILPISQLDNVNFLYEFDLVYSEDLGKKLYTDRKLHCCFNIYKRPQDGLNSKPIHKLKDVSIIRQDAKNYNNITDFDIRMCYWGDGTAGKILTNEDEKYSGEYKIIINNQELKEQIKDLIVNYNWREEIARIAMRRIKQYHIIDVLKKNIKGIS